MKEAALVSKQPGSHAYKTVDVERLDIPNLLDREFEVEAPNKVWCGDITYIWADNRWHSGTTMVCRREKLKIYLKFCPGLVDYYRTMYADCFC
jgi:transposase InsO family protein